MLSTSCLAAKEYSERGVQTDSPITLSPLASPSLLQMDSPPHGKPDDAEPHELESPLHTGSLMSPGHDEDAYSLDPIDSSFDSTSSGANQSMTTTSRAYRLEEMSANLPTTLANKQPSSPHSPTSPNKGGRAPLAEHPINDFRNSVIQDDKSTKQAVARIVLLTLVVLTQATSKKAATAGVGGAVTEEASACRLVLGAAKQRISTSIVLTGPKEATRLLLLVVVAAE